MNPGADLRTVIEAWKAYHEKAEEEVAKWEAERRKAMDMIERLERELATVRGRKG